MSAKYEFIIVPLKLEETTPYISLGSLDGGAQLLDQLVDLGSSRHVNVLVSTKLNNDAANDLRVDLPQVHNHGENFVCGRHGCGPNVQRSRN